MPPDRENIRFNTLRNALYHSARRRSLERLNRGFNFIVVVLGASAAGDVFAVFGVQQSWTAFVVAIVGAAQLVFDFGRQARDHQALQREYYLLLSQIEAKIDATAEECASWYSQLVKIAADEPPVLRAIDAKAYNDALDTLDLHDASNRLHIPWWQKPLAGFVAFEGARYLKLSERSAKSN